MVIFKPGCISTDSKSFPFIGNSVIISDLTKVHLFFLSSRKMDATMSRYVKDGGLEVQREKGPGWNGPDLIRSLTWGWYVLL